MVALLDSTVALHIVGADVDAGAGTGAGGADKV